MCKQWQRPLICTGPMRSNDAVDRAELAAEIIASLDGRADPDAATAWDDEIRRRVRHLKTGAEKLAKLLAGAS